MVTFKRFKDTGQLDFVESDKVFSPANGVEVAPDGKRVYVASNEGVRTFSRNTQTGALTPIGLTEGTDEKPLTTVGGLGAAPAGDHVYAAAGTTVSGVATLATKRTTKLGYQEFDNMGTGIGGTSAADVSPDGRHVYVSGGSNGSGKIGVYSRQPKLDLKGKKRQVASKLAVKAECSADCKVVLTGEGLKTATAKLQAGEPKRVRVRFKNSPPSSGKVTIKGKAKAGDRTAFDKLKVTLK